MFTEQQLKVLEAPLARERVKQRQGAGRFGNAFGLTLYDREQRNVAVPGARGQVASERREQPLDTAFTSAQRVAPTTSQRAIAAVRRPNGKGMVADVDDVPV